MSVLALPHPLERKLWDGGLGYRMCIVYHTTSTHFIKTILLNTGTAKNQQNVFAHVFKHLDTVGQFNFVTTMVLKAFVSGFSLPSKSWSICHIGSCSMTWQAMKHH